MKRESVCLEGLFTFVAGRERIRDDKLLTTMEVDDFDVGLLGGI